MSQKWRTMLGVSLGALCPPIGVSTISIGLLLGAFVLATWSWRGLFLINVPLGIAGTALALLFLQDEADRMRREPTSFDILGALIGSLALLCLLLVLSQGPSWGLASPPTI